MALFPLNFIISPRRRFIRGTLIIIGIIFTMIGVFSLSENGESKTLWVIDNSLSMAVSDITSHDDVIISRLDLAKALILSGSRMTSGDQAIMSVAHGAKLELPMNNDIPTIADVTNGINVITQGGGSNFLTPIQMIQSLYRDQSHVDIIWLTDGEFSDSGSTYTGSIDNLSITLIGIGSRAGGPILMGYNDEGVPRYKESGGVRVNSIRDDAGLARVADLLGAYTYLVDSIRDIDYSRIISSKVAPSHISWYTIFGTLILFVGLMVPRYRYTIKPTTGK